MGASNPPRTPHPSPLFSRESRLWYGIFEGRKREVAGTPVKEKREVPHTLGIYLNISSTVNSNSSYIGDKVAAVSKCQDSIHPMYSASLSIVLTCSLFTPLGPDHPWCASGNALTDHCACVSTWWNTVLCYKEYSSHIRDYSTVDGRLGR